MSETTKTWNGRRRDLQGLRAVAILLVLAYHFKLPGLSGGFIGVDVFFVLSGYFISRILMRDIEVLGRIQFAAFWAARAKRLLPNGLAVLAAILIAAILLLPAHRFPDIADATAFATAFLANFYFADGAIDYFRLGNPPSPVLHFWSLGVEEQFYLALPLFMALVAALFRNSRNAILLMLAAVAAISFAGSLIALQHNQPAAFFYPQYRAWQLAVGGLVSLYLERRTNLPPILGAPTAWTGVAAIIFSAVWLTEGTVYPGVLALLPTLGTAALLVGLETVNSTKLHSALASGPMVWIGDLSYSLYLWHWPVVVFTLAIWPDNQLAFALGLPVAFALAAFFYYAIECPFHRLSVGRIGSARVLLGSGTAVLAVFAAAILLQSVAGLTEEEKHAAIKRAQLDLGPNYAQGCHLDYDAQVQPPCRFGERKSQRRVVLFGDSHAAQWFVPIVTAAQNAGWALDVRTKTTCPPADVTIWDSPRKAIYSACNEWRAARLAELAKDPPTAVILTSWSRYQTWLYDPSTGKPVTIDEAENLWRDGYDRTIRSITDLGIAVIEIRDTPEMLPNYLDCLSDNEWASCSRPKDEALAGMASSNANSPPRKIVDLTRNFCDDTSCQAARGNIIIYRDTHHLTASFAGTLYAPFESALRDLR